MKQHNEELHFRIDQLRKDKIIFGVEAAAANLICLFGFLFSNQYFVQPIKDFINLTLLLMSVSYMIYVIIGNTNRLKEIKKLERELKY